METPGYSMNYGSAEDKETAKKTSVITNEILNHDYLEIIKDKSSPKSGDESPPRSPPPGSPKLPGPRPRPPLLPISTPGETAWCVRSRKNQANHSHQRP